MSLLVKETAGDTLTGAINGTNKVFETSFDFDDTFVNVYLNGILMQDSLETGYNLIPPRSVIMKEAPQSGPDGADTLEIEYKAVGVKTGGGALGGCPDAPILTTNLPEVQAEPPNVPQVITNGLEPTTGVCDNKSSVLVDSELRPRMLGTEGC